MHCGICLLRLERIDSGKKNEAKRLELRAKNVEDEKPALIANTEMLTEPWNWLKKLPNLKKRPIS